MPVPNRALALTPTPRPAAGNPVASVRVGHAHSISIEVPAGNYQMRVTNWDSETGVIDSGALTLAEGQVRTIVTIRRRRWQAFRSPHVEDLN